MRPAAARLAWRPPPFDASAAAATLRNADEEHAIRDEFQSHRVLAPSPLTATHTSSAICAAVPMPLTFLLRFEPCIRQISHLYTSDGHFLPLTGHGMSKDKAQYSCSFPCFGSIDTPAQ